MTFVRYICVFAMMSALAACVSAQIAGTAANGKVAVLATSTTADPKISLIEGNAVLVFDGDLISVAAADGNMYTIRLLGIDAPDRKQVGADRARRSLAAFVQGMDVKVVVRKLDERNHYVGTVYLDGEDVSLHQVEAGMAWHFRDPDHEQTSDESRKFDRAEEKARTGRLGLWDEKEPVPPWEFRGDPVAKSPAPVEPAAAVDTKKPAAAADIHEAGQNVDPAETQSEAAISAAGSSRAKGDPGAEGRKYILGPYGGCHYVGAGGRKVYVKDKTLCAK